MRTLVLHPVRSKGADRDPRDALAEAVSLAGALDLDVVGAEVVPLPKARAGTLFGKGKVEELTARIAEREVGLVVIDGAAVAGAAAQPREGVEGQGPRPDGADPRDLRRPGADPRGRAAGRARASQLPEIAAGAVLDPPGAAARRLRLPRRPRRDADRGRPPGARRADPADQAGARQGGADPRPAPPGAAAHREPGGGAGRLHQRRQVDALQPPDRRRACWPRTCSSPPSTRPCAPSRCPDGRRAILSDTVGFISDLPHQLVAAFRATLEEVLEADLILHVRDIAHPESEGQAEDVRTILAELGIDQDEQGRMLEVWNKIDALAARDGRGAAAGGGPDAAGRGDLGADRGRGPGAVATGRRRARGADGR